METPTHRDMPASRNMKGVSREVEVPFTAGRVVSLKERDTTVVKRDGDGVGKSGRGAFSKPFAQQFPRNLGSILRTRPDL